MKMKFKLILLIILLGIFGVTSCQNTLDYDPNYTEDRVVDDITEQDPFEETDSKPYAASNVSFEFVEMSCRGEEIPWTWNDSTRSIQIDTSEQNLIIWMDLNFVSNKIDSDYRDQEASRVISFNLRFYDSTLVEDIYLLNVFHKYYSRKLEMTIKDMKKQKEITRTWRSLRGQLQFTEINSTTGRIKGTFFSDLTYLGGWTLCGFKGKFSFYYK